MPFLGEPYSTPAFSLPPGMSFGKGPLNPTGQTPEQVLQEAFAKAGIPGIPGMSGVSFGSAPDMPGMSDPGMSDPGLAPNEPPQRKRINAKAAPAVPRGNGPLSPRSGPLARMPFGGAFANGGVAPAGKVSLVGERGPEAIIPTGPTKVIPLRNRNPLDELVKPINDKRDAELRDMHSFYQGLNQDYSQMSKDATNDYGNAIRKRDQFQPGTPEYNEADKDVQWWMNRVRDHEVSTERTKGEMNSYGSQIGTGQGMRDLQTMDRYSQMAAEARMAEMRAAREKRPGGQNFVGPMPSPAAKPATPAGSDQPATGMLVPTSNGGYKWQPGTGPGTSLPPQSRAAAAPASLDAAFQPARAAGGSRIPRSPTGWQGYAEMPGSTGSLANRGARPIGRSMAEAPERRLETAARRGDMRAVSALVGLKQQGIDRAFQSGQAAQQRDFWRERDAQNFNQSMQMRGLDQAFTESRDARARQDALDAEGRQQQRRDTEWQRNRDAEMQDRQNQSIDSAFTMTSPDGQFFVPMVKDKGGNARPMGGAFPVPKPGATPEQIQKMQEDAAKKGYDLMQLPNGEWKLQKRDAPPPAGWETTTTDAEGNTSRSVRRPLGGAGAAGSRTSGTGIF